MNTLVKAYTGAQIHDGQRTHDAHALVMHRDGTLDLQPVKALPEGCPVETLNGAGVDAFLRGVGERI